MSDTTADILFLLWNLIQWMMWFYLLHRLLAPKMSSWITYVIECAASAAGILLCNYVVVDYGALRTGVALASYVVPTILLHKGSFFRKLVACISVFFSMICVETLFMFMMPNLVMEIAERHLNSPAVFLYYIEYMLFQGLLLAVIYFTFQRWDSRVSKQLTEREGWLFFLFPISQLILITGWYFNFVTDLSAREVVIIAIVSAFCVASDILLFRMIRRTAENAKLQTQNELLNEQITVQSNYYRLLAKNYSDMSKLRHDIANHLYTIEILLQDNKKSEAMEYAAELRQTDLVRSLLSDCHNTVIGTFLQHKTDELSAEGVDISCRVSIPAQLAIPDTDIIIALGNILDNAAEACKQSSVPWIDLTLTYQDSFLRFEVKNSCPQQLQAKKRRIPYLERGIGKEILQALSEKYHGNFNSYIDGQAYHTILVLRENPADFH